MKKILSIALIIGCIFAFASCALTSPNTTPAVDNEGKKQTLDAIQACIDDSAPKSADLDVVYTSEIGQLNGSYDVVYHDDGSATVEYSYELFNPIDPTAGMTEFKSVYTGVINVSANGELDTAINGVASVEALSFDILLDSSKLSNCVIEAGILNAVVKSENTIDVIGIDIPYDITLQVRTAKEKVTAVVIAYNTANGAIEITAEYHY